MTVLTVANQKGGVGKTTTSLLLGQGLERMGFKVLLIDTDPQANLSTILKLENQEKNIFNVLVENEPITRAVYRVSEGLYCLPSGVSASMIDFYLSSKVGKELALKKALKPIRDYFDFIVIDTPPSLNTITNNALACSDGLILVSETSQTSLDGLGYMMQIVEAIKEVFNESLNVLGVLLVEYNPKLIVSKKMIPKFEDFTKKHDTRVFDAKIGRCTKITDSQIERLNLFEHYPKESGVKDYQEFIEELLKSIK